MSFGTQKKPHFVSRAFWNVELQIRDQGVVGVYNSSTETSLTSQLSFCPLSLSTPVLVTEFQQIYSLIK